MHHALVALRAHGDLTKFEFEDGLLRRIIPERLARPSTIQRVVVDIRAEDQHDIGTGGTERFSGLLWISAGDRAELTDTIDGPLVEIGTITNGWLVHTDAFGDVEASWVGTATPGIKLIAFVHKAPAADPLHFGEWLTETAESLARRVDGGSASSHLVVGEVLPSPELGGLITIRFPTVDELNRAEEDGILESLAQDDMVDTDEKEHVLAFEHRLEPDPDHWET